MEEVVKGCIGLDASNNMEIDNGTITADDITNHINTECKETGEETKFCFCDTHDYCNGGKSKSQAFYKIVVLLVIVFCA